MDEALRIHDYLPISYANHEEEAYIRFLWDAFETNYSAEKYEFANLAFHLLYMSFVCFSVWQIRAARSADFDRAMVGYANEVENKLMKADSPFRFTEILKGDSGVFRFLKLLGCTNEQIGEYARFLKKRNKIAHPCATVSFASQQDIDDHIGEVLTEVESIQSRMTPVLHDCLRTFLEQNADPEGWEYSLPKDQIDAVLIHAHYFSRKDIDACLAFDVSAFDTHAEAVPIRELFDNFQDIYRSEAED
ncbi:hypothetical protein [Thiocystis violacea]|uniref:hypothetical protein n=1 Tax=Thiocystis violacea TaxID=13725 RepID=UPI0019085BF3|nr:hypothetical protein [Thiocystis violacea]MBK1720308.1 hypothetical protein [Thiocystis violacea]